MTRAIISFVFTCMFLADAPRARELTFQQRVDAELAIQEIYQSYREGAEGASIPRRVAEDRVVETLKRSAALASIWDAPVTAEALAAEMKRIERGSRLPGRLRELYAALEDDPFLIQETFVRSILVERLTRHLFESDRSIHAAAHEEAVDLRDRLSRGGKGDGDPRQARVLELSLAAPGTDRAPRRDAENDRVLHLEVSAAELARWRALGGGGPGSVGPVRDDGEAFTVRVILAADPARLRIATHVVPKIAWDEWWADASEELSAGDVGPVASEVSDSSILQESSLSSDSGGAALTFPDDSWDNGSLGNLPEARYDHTAIWTGSEMIVWGGTNGMTLGIGGRYDPLTDTWAPIAGLGAPEPRRAHTAVWTGSRMIVWGGTDESTFNTGGRYDPVSNTWSATSNTGAPVARGFHSAVWTGSRMIVWGGGDGTSDLSSGGQYDPVADNWAATTLSGVPPARSFHTAVWTGTHMVVWGGSNPIGGVFADGGRYDPAMDSWQAVTATGAPSARDEHTAVWTGSRMVIWGGADATDTPMSSGARYDPAGDAWSGVTNSGAPTARARHTAVWTGTRMIVWGGVDSGGNGLATGSRYDPAGDSWSSTSTSNAPGARSDHVVVWTGSLMLVWGGFGTQGIPVDTGGRYNPTNNSWSATATRPGPTARAFHTAVWTGSEMIVWGGSGTSGYFQSGGRYDPMADTWTSTSTASAPVARDAHTAVWTGSVMIVWGGNTDSGLANTGGRYNPVSNGWTATTTTSAPAGRSFHTAVWTGNEMIVWGGDGASDVLSTGGRYDPSGNSWTATQNTGAPTGRRFHTAVWTGNEMIVWGGRTSTTRLSSGGRYDPLANIWTPTSLLNVPQGRTDHTAVWTGSQMIVWGGFSPFSERTGGRYDPSSDTWTDTALSGAPSQRGFHTAVWTGSRMVVWGGSDTLDQFEVGGRYNPFADAWEGTTGVDAPIGRDFARAVTTGDMMIVWGGLALEALNSGGRYSIVPADTDGDGADDVDDCAPLDITTFGDPDEVEVTDVLGVSPTTIHYTEQNIGSSTTYQIVSGLLTRLRQAMSFQEGFCLIDSTSGGSYEDTRVNPPPGDGWYYLIRSVNPCGAGTLGSVLADEPGAGDVCELGIVDSDVDGLASDVDCNDTDPLAQKALTAEAQDVLLSFDGTIIIWSSVQPVDPSTVLYELARGLVGELPVGSGGSELCVTQGIDFTVAFDPAEPPPGEAFWYLPRARNGCGPSTYGFRSDGTENITSACP